MILAELALRRLLEKQPAARHGRAGSTTLRGRDLDQNSGYWGMSVGEL